MRPFVAMVAIGLLCAGSGCTCVSDVDGFVFGDVGPLADAGVTAMSTPTTALTDDNGAFHIPRVQLPDTFIVGAGDALPERVYRGVGVASPSFGSRPPVQGSVTTATLSVTIQGPSVTMAQGNFLHTVMFVSSGDELLTTVSSNIPGSTQGFDVPVRASPLPSEVDLLILQAELNPKDGPVRFLGQAEVKGVSVSSTTPTNVGVVTLDALQTSDRDVVVTAEGTPALTFRLWMKAGSLRQPVLLTGFGTRPPGTLTLHLPAVTGATFDFNASFTNAEEFASGWVRGFSSAGPAVDLAVPAVPWLTSSNTDLSWNVDSTLPLCTVRISDSAGVQLVVYTTERRLPLPFLREKPGRQLQPAIDYLWSVECTDSPATVDEAVSGKAVNARAASAKSSGRRLTLSAP